MGQPADKPFQVRAESPTPGETVPDQPADEDVDWMPFAADADAQQI